VKDGAVAGGTGISVGYSEGIHTVDVNLATTSHLDKTSGLKVDVDSFKGNGLDYTSNKLVVKTNTKGALKVDTNGVDLDTAVAGDGLTYTVGTDTTTATRTRLSV